MEIKRIEKKHGRELMRLGDVTGFITSTSGSSYVRRATEMSHSRFIYDHVCTVCGVSFAGIKTAKTCSNSCRQKAKRARAKHD